VYRTEREKLNAIVEEIREMVEEGRPVLVGTTSIGKSEKLAQLLKRSGVKHVVLNAKYHQMEAEIVAQAGRPGAVTIATNMAGRGTDILLGGNPEYAARNALKKQNIDPMEAEPEVWEQALEAATKDAATVHEAVVEAGGLHILATERHESRRIDNQLRGRAGRQGDPGSSRFFLSLEDDLMRIFGSDRISGLMQRMGMEEGVPIEHKMVTNAIERAQKQVEGQNFAIRKHLLEYDDVMNKQRVAIYRLRRDILEGKEQRDYILELADNILGSLLDQYLAEELNAEEWDVDGFRTAISAQYGLDSTTLAKIDWEGLNRNEIREALSKKLHEKYENKEHGIGPDLMRTHERIIMFTVERPPLRDGSPQRGDWPARLWPARSPHRVQERKLQHVRGHVGPPRRRDRPDPVLAATRARADVCGAASREALTADVQRSHRHAVGVRGASTLDRAAARIAGRCRCGRFDGQANRGESRAQLAVSLRKRQKVQEVLWRGRLDGNVNVKRFP
jgi:preprotein translocase subunit SecA